MHTPSIALFLAVSLASASAFTAPSFGLSKKCNSVKSNLHMSSFDDDFLSNMPGQTEQHIQDLVDDNPVLLFMKGSKIFPQCGFSSTAVQILNTFNINFHTGKSN